ncbi:unnamed protein product [Coccothraustes coccothraustes]
MGCACSWRGSEKNKRYNRGSLGIFPDFSMVSAAAGCESLLEGRVLESMHYPEHYSNLAGCQWIIYAPEDHAVKLTYQSFEVEESEDCSYDAMNVYEDVGKEEEIVESCGFALPAPAPSSSAVMLVVFHPDETETFGGFRATVSFVHLTGNRKLNRNLGKCLLGAAQRALQWIGCSE